MSLIDKAMGADKVEYVPDISTLNPRIELEKLAHFVDKIRKGLEGRVVWEKHIHKNKSHDYIGTEEYPRDDVPITIRGAPPFCIPAIQKGKRECIDTWKIVREKRVDVLLHFYDNMKVSISQRDGRFLGHARTCLHVACAIGMLHATPGPSNLTYLFYTYISFKNI